LFVHSAKESGSQFLLRRFSLKYGKSISCLIRIIYMYITNLLPIFLLVFEFRDIVKLEILIFLWIFIYLLKVNSHNVAAERMFGGVVLFKRGFVRNDKF